jgi:phospholipid/cholesterol/gamma-HCH transport system substrate-binding protein
MAAVPITLIGAVTYDNGNVQNVTFNGVAALAGLSVGGGPAEPPPTIWPGPGRPTHPIAPGGQPPGIWPPPGQPAHPIVLPPIEPGGPPVVWPPDARPEHPIAPPPPPPEGVKPPPEGGGWGYHPDYGWGFFPMGSAAGPKAY